MLILAGTVLAVLAAGAMALVVLGFAAFVERRWRDGVIKLAIGGSSTVLVMVALAFVARSLLSAEVWTAGVDPGVKARFLGESISGLMNVTVLGLPAGLVAGFLLAWRQHARAKAR